MFKYEYVVNDSVDKLYIKNKYHSDDSFDNDVDDVIKWIERWHKHFTRNRDVHNIYIHVTCERNAKKIEKEGLYSQYFLSDKNHLRMGDYDKAGGKTKSKNRNPKSKSRKNKSKNKSKSRKSNMFL